MACHWHCRTAERTRHPAVPSSSRARREAVTCRPWATWPCHTERVRARRPLRALQVARSAACARFTFYLRLLVFFSFWASCTIMAQNQHPVDLRNGAARKCPSKMPNSCIGHGRLLRIRPTRTLVAREAGYVSRSQVPLGSGCAWPPTHASITHDVDARSGAACRALPFKRTAPPWAPRPQLLLAENWLHSLHACQL